MANRSVVVQLSAQVGGYIAAMTGATAATTRLAGTQAATSRSTQAMAASQNAAGAAVGGLSGKVQALNAHAQQHAAAWDTAGKSLLVYGTGAVAALGAVSKAAMDWQSSWAGVTKTVDGSASEMAELETGLRGLAKTLPITHTEIAGVAEAAGQLGVARKDILGFTKTMVDLGVSTDLTAEEAATSIAQISNVMGTMSREGAQGVSRFGATLVALGNDGASTESQILAMAQRIAGAGATVGATEVDVLALSNTLASMGVQAELGGGVATRVLLKMFSAVKEGGPKLEAFARTAGVTAEEFASAYNKSPVQALDMVAQGLNRVNEEGGNVVAVMGDLGIKGTQETQVMLSLANSGTLLADSLALGSKSWAENTALVEEATKRYDTAESRVRIAWNNIKDAAISAGAVMLPVIANIADAVSSLANWFGQLPAPVMGALTVVAGLTGAAALLAGGFLVLFPRVVNLVSAFKTLGVSGSAAAGGLKKLGAALGIAGLLMAAAGAFKAYYNAQQPAVASTDEMTQALLGLKKNADSLDNIFANIDPGGGGTVLKDINDIGDAIARLNSNTVNDNIGQWANSFLNIDNDFGKLESAITNVDTALAGFVTAGNLEGAATGFKSIAASAEEQGVSLEELQAKFPAYMDSLRQAASAAGVHVEEADMLNWAMGKTPQVMLDAAAATDEAAAATASSAEAAEQAEAAAEEFADAMAELGLSTEGVIQDLAKYTEALFASGLAVMGSREAAFAWEESMRTLGDEINTVMATSAELGGTVNATGTDFDRMTKAGQDANTVFQDLIKEGLSVAQTFGGDVTKSAADVNQQLQSTYEAGVTAAQGLGLSEEAAIALTREVMQIPDGVSIETWMSEQALLMAGQTGDTVRDIPESVLIQSSMDAAAYNMAGKTKQAADDVPEKETIDSWMSDAAFLEAIKTRAAAEGIPPDVAIDSFMQSAARNEADSTTAQILKIPKGASITSYMQEYARLEAERLKAALSAVDGKTVNTYTNHHTTWIETKVYQEGTQMPGRGGSSPRAAKGGRLQDVMGGLAGGGRVPGARSANPLVDNVLALVDGRPLGLEGTEWVINPRSSETYDDELEAINNGSFPKNLLTTALSGGREWGAPAATSSMAGGKTEKHYHTHVSSAPGMEQSYAQAIAKAATQRQQDIALAYGID